MAEQQIRGTDPSRRPEQAAEVIRLGYIDYLNCLPVYFGIEKGVVDLSVIVTRGVPSQLNTMLVQGLLDITPMSSIEYARHAADCLILPDLSISADGPVGSILLFHKRPLAELDGRLVAMPSSSATSVVLARVILEERYGVRPRYFTAAPDIDAMLNEADAALLIGDDALLAAHNRPELAAVDLGLEWKALTGEVMVFALWVMRREFAERNPAAVGRVAALFRQSQDYGMTYMQELIDEGVRRRGLPRPVVEDYFGLIRHELTPAYRRGVRTFFEHAVRIGELARVPDLEVWGER